MTNRLMLHYREREKQSIKMHAHPFFRKVGTLSEEQFRGYVLDLPDPVVRERDHVLDLEKYPETAKRYLLFLERAHRAVNEQEVIAKIFLRLLV